MRTSLLVVLAAAVVGATPALAGAKVRRPTLEWDPRIEEIAHRVEHLRGLEFKAPVEVHLDAPDVASDGMTEPRSYLRQEARHLQALGLIQDGDAYVRARSQIGGPAWLGVYQPSSQSITVARGSFDALTKVVVAHELTHALDDQHFDIDAGDRKSRSLLSSNGYRAVVEGDARRIEDRYFAAMPRRERRAALREYERALAGTFPASVDRSVLEWSFVESDLPYTVGKELTRFANVRRGDDLSRMLRRAPRHDLDVVDPLDELDHWTSERVQFANGETRDGQGDAFGAIDLYLLLAGRIPVGSAFDTVTGLRGSAVAYFRREGTACARLALRARTGAESSVSTGLQSWVAAVGADATLDTVEPGLFSVTSCGAASPLAPRATSVAELALAARTRLLADATHTTRTDAQLRCLGRAALDDQVLLSRLERPQRSIGGTPPGIRGVISRAERSCRR